MIKNTIVSFLIGLGKVIPGVSGSMLAISFGIYDKIIESILNPIKNIKFIISFIPGFIIAIVLGSNIILYLLNNHYFLTMTFFIGLISGGLPKIINIAYKKFSLKQILATILSIIFSMLLLLVNNTNTLNNISYPFLIIVGAIEAITTIIPGISGTAILMIIGYYDKVINFLNNILNYNEFVSTLLFGIPYAIGLIIGIYLTSKIVNYMTKKHEELFYSIIVGLAISSIILMFKSIFTTNIALQTLIESIILLTLGYIISSKLDK